MTTHPARHDLVEALRKARPIVEADFYEAKSSGDADWEGQSYEALAAIDAALASEAASQVPADATRDVLSERERQKAVEGWTPEHDDDYAHFELARAASCYAAEAAEPTRRPAEEGDRPYNWPWHSDWWKPSGRRRNLVKAGALILAEIERLDRAAAPDQEGPADGK